MSDLVSVEYKHPIRLSKRRIRTNPVLESIRVYKSYPGSTLRHKEESQLARLLELQQEGISVHRKPDFQKVDCSELKITNERVGVVGLLVDNSGIGLVTQVKAELSAVWDVSHNLPFQHSHIQSLLLSVLGESVLDEGLPELLAFKISDTLGDRCEGDSMDIAGLLAIVDAANGSKHELLGAVAAVVSPADENELEPSKSVSIKLDAFKREFGRGTLLVRFAEDLEAMNHDDAFDVVWPIRNLRELSHKLSEAGIFRCLNQQFAIGSEHGLAITSQMQRLLASESTYVQASNFIQRVRHRIAADTPLRTKLEISYAEEDLHRHTGNFDEAIAVRKNRVELENNSLISCYERMADSDNRHAAALYDAHRFTEAIQCLEPWLGRLRLDPKICLPETRSFLFNTLGRCLVAVCDPRWEEMFDASLQIQRAVSPANVPRTENSLVHGYLKCNRLSDAAIYLDKELTAKTIFESGCELSIRVRSDQLCARPMSRIYRILIRSNMFSALRCKP